MVDILNITDSVYFVRNTKEIIKTLFAGNSTTASGTFKIYKNRVIFFGMDAQPFAALIVNNKGDKPFFVNCGMLNGKMFYQYALGELQKQKLGISHCGYKSENDKAENVAYHAGLWEFYIKPAGRP